MCPTIYQDQILSNFIESLRSPSKLPAFRRNGIWLSEVAVQTERSNCLTWAIRAVAVSHLGRAAADEDLVETSRRIYGKALLKLNDALR